MADSHGGLCTAAANGDLKVCGGKKPANAVQPRRKLSHRA